MTGCVFHVARPSVQVLPAHLASFICSRRLTASSQDSRTWYALRKFWLSPPNSPHSSPWTCGPVCSGVRAHSSPSRVYPTITLDVGVWGTWWKKAGFLYIPPQTQLLSLQTRETPQGQESSPWFPCTSPQLLSAQRS